MPTRIKVLLIALVVAGLGIFVSLAFIGGGSGGCQLPDGIEEVWVFTDGDVPDWPAVHAAVAKANEKAKAKIHVVFLGAPDPSAAGDAAEALAKQNGGTCVRADGTPYKGR